VRGVAGAGENVSRKGRQGFAKGAKEEPDWRQLRGLAFSCQFARCQMPVEAWGWFSILRHSW
jgi:hypothetical protein